MAASFFIILAFFPLIFKIIQAQTATNQCGIDYSHSLDCHQACPSGFSTECPPGESCFASVPCSNPDPSNWCGTSYEAAKSCSQPCPMGTNSECGGLTCYSGISECSANDAPSPVSPPMSSPASYSGFYLWTWNPTPGFSSATLSVAFSGWMNVDNALAESANVFSTLVGEKYISFGGGNANGRWSASRIGALNDAISANRLSGYNGICYDIEEGDQNLGPALENSFAVAKAKKLKVLVTVSHSSPYGFPDANNVMDTIISSTNVDFLSPQLYTTGMETTNDYTISNNYGWDNYRRSSAKILLSIPRANMFSDGQQFFASQKVDAVGYIQWRNAL